MFQLSERSKKNLQGVHPDLCKTVSRALEISEIDFCVIEGLRTPERQKELVNSGASQTLFSRHITGHAVDVAPIVAGSIRWDWPLFYKLANAFKTAAFELNISIVWGGDWKNFKDGPHFELSRKDYP